MDSLPLFLKKEGDAVRTLELIQESNELADENESNATVLGFLNQAIAKINIELNCEFPYLELTNEDAPVFPERWQRTLLIPFAVGRIKQKDSSQFEYSDAYGEFLDNLDNFRQKYNVPIIYRILSSNQNIILEDETIFVTGDNDTFYSIAQMFDMDAWTLASLNRQVQEDEESIQASYLREPPHYWFTF